MGLAENVRLHVRGMVWVGCFVVVVVVVGAAVMVIFITLALLFTLPMARKETLLSVAWPVDRSEHVPLDTET
ncbi:hypothetical protein KC354_g81 [Hortaea werneckii]|nr:hypothetical protein KC354_g81 [Hortaea werneckii]